MSGRTIASLQAIIGGDVSSLERAGNQAKSILNSVADTAKKTSTQTASGYDQLSKAQFTANGALNGWSRSMYTAATAGGMLTDKAISLQKAVDSGTMSAKHAQREYNAFESQMKSMTFQSMTLGEKYGVVKQKLASVGTEMLKVGAAGAGVMIAGKQIYDFAKSGAQLEYTQTRFDRLSRSMGTTSSVLMDQLRVATKGTVSDMGLATQAANMFQLGLVGSADEAVRLSKIQTALGMDTGELTLALANQSKRRLDQLGLSLSRFNEIEGKLKDKGLSKEEAFKQAFMLTAEETIATTGNMADLNLGSFQRLEAGGANIWNQMKMSAPNMGMGWLFGGDTMAQTADKVGMFLNGVSNIMSGQNVLDLSGGLGADSWVRQATAQDKSSLWAGGGRQRVGNNPYAAITGLSAVQNYTAMAYQYGSAATGGLGATPPGAEEAPVDYAAMTDGAMKLTAASRSYADSVAQITERFDDNKVVRELFKSDVAILKDQLKDGEITNSQYYDSVQKLTSAWKDGSYAAGKQNAAMQALDEQYNAQGAAFALNLMQQDEMFDPQKAYDFAAATGQITKQAAEQYKAYTKIKDALNDNALNADQAAYASRALSGDIRALNGMTSKVWIDVYIRTHGTMIAGLGTVGTTGEDFGSKRRAGGEIGFASGTPDIGRSGLFRVGEMGEEGLVVHDDGSIGVIPAHVWSQMGKYGVGADGGFAGGLKGVSAAGNLRRTGGSLRRPGGSTAKKRTTGGSTSTGVLSAILPPPSQDIPEVSQVMVATQQASQAQMEAVTQASQQQTGVLSDILAALLDQPNKRDARNNARAANQKSI